MRKLIYIFIGIFSILSISQAQVTELKYLLQYNCETTNYDVNLKILKGSANSVMHRAQFNSQLTILVPTGMSFEIVDRYLPLVSNQQYESTTPNEWSTFSPVLSPTGHDDYDFYSIVPKLTPASFFNDLAEGDEVMLFSFSVGENAAYDNRIRFFDNSTDVKLSNFEGSDLRNGYSLGGATNRYTGNIHENCITTTDKTLLKNKAKIYPNPTDSKIYIDTPSQSKSIKVIDIKGSIIKEIKTPKAGTHTIDVESLAKGNYYVQIEALSGDVDTQLFSVY